MRITFFLVGIIMLTPGVLAEVKLPAIFGDHMVLQQKEHVTIWGWADPGEKIEVKGSWQWIGEAETKADENGQWKITLKTPKAGKTGTLTVKGNNKIVINDILFGEVWICSGQSNMEWMMKQFKTDRIAADTVNANIPGIRLFTVKRKVSATPKADVQGTWQICSPETVKDFSATGFYFGKNLHAALDVPVGLISTNWGGTKAEAWTSRQGLESFEPLQKTLAYLKDPKGIEEKLKQEHDQAVKKWEADVSAVDRGIPEKWYAETIDETGWQEMKQPQKWSQADNALDDIDGIVWFRRNFNLPPSWVKHDLELHLGQIDDMDTVWINGVKIGTTTEDWTVRRVYTIPASVLHVGKNTAVVRIIDNQGDGGFASDNADDMRIGPPGADVKNCATVANTWKYKVAFQGDVPRVPKSTININQNTPTVLYNAMIAPLIPFRIAGTVWYQGESNSESPILYRTLFPAMIEDWRDNWGQGDFPFYYVQIAPFEYNKKYSYGIREAQMMTLNAVSDVGMAVTMDIGEKGNIHPENKYDVGDRLARWALAKTYGKEDIVYSGPIYKSMTVEDGKIRVSFDYIDGGLSARGGGLKDFEIAGADKVFVPAKVVIDGNTLVVSNDEVKKPVAVRYGWSNWVIGSLFNKAGLPASSFRTDDWPLQ